MEEREKREEKDSQGVGLWKIEVGVSLGRTRDVYGVITKSRNQS